MDKKYIIGIVTLAAIAAGVVLYQEKNSGTPAPNDMTGPESTEATPSPAPAASSKKAATSQVFTYEETVERYTNQRIQFTSGCLANPTSVTFKSGTQVMFDNRGGEKRVVTIGGTGYVIGPYGYIIIPLASKTLPATMTVDCGAQKNVAQILLQK